MTIWNVWGAALNGNWKAIGKKFTVLRVTFSASGEEKKSHKANQSVDDWVWFQWQNASGCQDHGCVCEHPHPCGAADSKYSTCLSDLARRASDVGNSCGGRQSGSWTTPLGSRWQDKLNTGPRTFGDVLASHVSTYKTARQEDRMKHVRTSKRHDEESHPLSVLCPNGALAAWVPNGRSYKKKKPEKKNKKNPYTGWIKTH